MNRIDVTRGLHPKRQRIRAVKNIGSRIKDKVDESSCTRKIYSPIGKQIPRNKHTIASRKSGVELTCNDGAAESHRFRFDGKIVTNLICNVAEVFGDFFKRRL